MQTSTAIKEEEIRPEDVFSEFMHLSAADAQNFFNRTKFVHIPCPACGAKKKASEFEKHSFTYNECAECGSLYVSPRPDPSELLRYYAQSKSQKFWADTVLKKTNTHRKESILIPNLERVEKALEARGKDPKSILDVGAANGAFLTEWRSRHGDAALVAIEPGQEAAQKCRDADIKVYEGFVEDEAGKAGAQGDLVVCFEVLEHVQNPENFAKALYKVTMPDGTCIITCLGLDGFDIQVLWEKSRSIMPPYHLNFLSSKGIETLFIKAGFRKVEVLTPGRLDVEIVKRSIERGIVPELSRFEKFLLSKDENTLKAFQKFLSENGLSSHVWIICHRG
jgi:SAM-dependent methyltransferase/predicted RNA-binding Zn-ribbon protein involved in translation (DUF1610 family)